MRKYLTVENTTAAKKAGGGSAPNTPGAAKGKTAAVATKAATVKKAAPVEREPNSVAPVRL
jgi:hypothetical protein